VKQPSTNYSTILVQGQKPHYADLTFANTIKTELLKMARDNDTLFIYIVNVKEWQNTEGKIKIILSFSGN